MPHTRAAPSLFEKYKALTTSNRLRFPLVGQENRPIYDDARKLVSIPENAQMFIAAANLTHEIATFNIEHSFLDGEITDDQAIGLVVKWIERAKKILEQKL